MNSMKGEKQVCVQEPTKIDIGSAGFNWPSPAKINLFLHITGRRNNGYHELQTLFQILSFGDSLDFHITKKSNIVLKTPMDGVPDKDNLIVKAAKLLQSNSQYTKQPELIHSDIAGCEISIQKCLPMGGGIGGGSSNAATTLVALNLLWGLNLNIEQLCNLGLQLGADVPVFVRGQSAFAEGVGDIIYPTEIPEKTYLIVNPGVHVSTPEVFSDISLPRNTPSIDWSSYSFETTRNDCETLVCEKYPVIAKTLQWLLQYAPSRMTGTGASLFAIFDHPEDAQKALNDIPDGCTAFIAKSCNHSPLLTKVESAKKQLFLAEDTNS